MPKIRLSIFGSRYLISNSEGLFRRYYHWPETVEMHCRVINRHTHLPLIWEQGRSKYALVLSINSRHLSSDMSYRVCLRQNSFMSAQVTVLQPALYPTGPHSTTRTHSSSTDPARTVAPIPMLWMSRPRDYVGSDNDKYSKNTTTVYHKRTQCF